MFPNPFEVVDLLDIEKKMGVAKRVFCLHPAQLLVRRLESLKNKELRARVADAIANGL